MIIRLATFVAVASLLWQWDKRRRAIEQQRAMEQPKAKPPAVSTWESEGGALPSVGAQLGPAASRS